MNKLEPNHDLSLRDDYSFLSQFSSGIEYCGYEKQIDLSSSLLAQEKQEIALALKIKQILTTWKKFIIKYNCQQIEQKENQLVVEKSKFLRKKLSTETAWTSSLLALTSVGIMAKIAPIWSEINQIFSLKTPLLKTTISLKGSADRLFPLLVIEEIDLIMFGRNDVNNVQNKTLVEINNVVLSQPINSPMNQQKWLMCQTKTNGSLMAIPLLHNQLSLAGFPSFLSTLDIGDSKKDSHVNQFDLLNQNKLLSYSSDSVTYHIEDNLMATPKTFYKPYLPTVNFLERSQQLLLK